MSTASSLTLRGVLADPALRESLMASAVMVVATAGLVLLGCWLFVIRGALRQTGSFHGDWLVVCGHVLEAGRPSAVYRRRLRRAATLALKDERLQVLLTGGGEPSEAAVGRDWLQVETGLSPARIHLEEWSTDTFANLQHARAILPEGACVGLVSSRFHLARVSVYARHLGLRTVPVPAEAAWRFTPAGLLASAREAGFLCWFVCGRVWARLARRRALLERIR